MRIIRGGSFRRTRRVIYGKEHKARRARSRGNNKLCNGRGRAAFGKSRERGDGERGRGGWCVQRETREIVVGTATCLLPARFCARLSSFVRPSELAYADTLFIGDSVLGRQDVSASMRARCVSNNSSLAPTY